MVTDAGNLGKQPRGRTEVVFDYSRGTALYNMNGNLVGSTERQNLRFSTPSTGVLDRHTVLLELLWSHETCICCTHTVFTECRRQKGQKVIWVCVDEVRCSCADDDVVGLSGRKYVEEG